MKTNKLNFKNLFKNEFEISLFKIIATLLMYLIIVFIFKAGYEFQRTVEFKSKQQPIKTEKINYTLILNSKTYTTAFNSKKDVLNILESQKDLTVDYQGYFKGVKITGINNYKNISIKVNGEVLKDNFIAEGTEDIKEDSIIVVTAYWL